MKKLPQQQGRLLKRWSYLKKSTLLMLVSFMFTSLGMANNVSSIAALATAASNSNQTITMTPGVYSMGDYLTTTVLNGLVPDVYGRTALFTFSGSNNTFDFTGVTIEVPTEYLNDFQNIIEFHITGDNVTIKGLTITDIGTDNTANGGQSLTVTGDYILLEDITMNVNGSFPYGYGDLLGKGGGSLVTMRKHSGMLLEGYDIVVRGCSIISEAFGHLFFIQGGREILFEDCYAQAYTRTTDDMLAETSGIAFDKAFESVYPNYNGVKVITPGYTKSLSEVGFRTYGTGYNGETTGKITVRNCKAVNTRVGFALTRAGGDILVQNCEAIGCEAGYNIDGVIIENSRGDAVNGPLLYINNSTIASTVDLALLPTLNTTTLHAIATVSGNLSHDVTLRQSGITRTVDHPIIIGATRPTATNPFSPLGSTATSGITLNNCTEMPVEIQSNVSSSIINSNGSVTDSGTGNTVNTSYSCQLANVAVGGAVEQSSTAYEGEASRAVDGDTNGAWSGDSVTHTASETNPWWEVDLGNYYDIDDIVIYGRTDSCCKSRLNDFTVTVLDESGSTSSFSQTFTTVPDPSVTANTGGASGQIVRVQLNGTNVLSLAEVQVFGEKTTMPIAGKTYYIDCPRWDARLGADGSEDAYTTAITTTGANVEWTLTESSTAGYYWLDCNGGGSNPRIRTDQTDYADMQATSSSGSWTKWQITPSSTSGRYLLTTQDQTVPRIQIDNVGDVRMTATSATGSWSQFTFTEVPSLAPKAIENENISESITFEYDTKISIYPNPVENVLTINGAKDGMVNIYNTSGKVIYTSEITNDSEQLDISGISSGIYYTEVIGTQEKSIFKLIKK